MAWNGKRRMFCVCIQVGLLFVEKGVGVQLHKGVTFPDIQKSPKWEGALFQFEPLQFQVMQRAPKGNWVNLQGRKYKGTHDDVYGIGHQKQNANNGDHHMIRDASSQPFKFSPIKIGAKTASRRAGRSIEQV